jgi:hypothetical protein
MVSKKGVKDGEMEELGLDERGQEKWEDWLW